MDAIHTAAIFLAALAIIDTTALAAPAIGDTTAYAGTTTIGEDARGIATGRIAEAPSAPGNVAEIHRAAVERILALDPERISESDVRDVLSHAPAPRVILMHGSVAVVTMQPFAEFLIAMGYPEDRLRNPNDGTLSSSSFAGSAAWAGTIAWHYENDAMAPMLIGLSQGGMMVIRTLHELAGEFAESIPVWDPRTNTSLPRTKIVDPYTKVERPVIGINVPYAAAIATGKLPRIVFGQWQILPLLRKIPDTVGEFTGFSIEWDAIAGDFPWSERYRAIGSASVRNVLLPAAYLHVDLPRTQHLAANAATRAWISAYKPGTDIATLNAPGVDTSNAVHAADIWYSIKKHWCLEAQRLLGDRRGQ